MESLSPLSALSPLTNLSGATDNASPQPSAPAPDVTGPAWLDTATAKIVTILLGLILIVAGLFSFERVREVVNQDAETITKTAKAAAVAAA